MTPQGLLSDVGKGEKACAEGIPTFCRGLARGARPDGRGAAPQNVTWSMVMVASTSRCKLRLAPMAAPAAHARAVAAGLRRAIDRDQQV